MTQKSCYQAKQHLCAKTRSQLCVLAHNSILPCHVCWTSHGTRDSLISYDQLDSFLAFHGPRKEAAEKNIYCKENKLWTPPKAKDIMREASKKGHYCSGLCESERAHMRGLVWDWFFFVAEAARRKMSGFTRDLAVLKGFSFCFVVVVVVVE
jgi:hypothetical protein